MAMPKSKSMFPMQEINSAYKECKFGLFHIKLIAIDFVSFVAAALVSNTTSFLLPNAECDLHMSLVQKGLLNAMPYIGMLLASLVTGFMTDTFGRKIFIVGGNLGRFIFFLISGSSQTYEVLLFAKFFEGVTYSAAYFATVTLLSEYCHDGIRDRVLLCHSSFVSLGQILEAAMAWGILTNEWKLVLFNGSFVLNTWNFYLYAMSLWPLTAAILYTLFIPESPKYLITKNKYDEARRILIKMYTQNTWKAAETYPYYNIWRNKSKYILKEGPESETEKCFRHQILIALHNMKLMFQKPLVFRLILISLQSFIVRGLHNIFRLWYPQVSTIVEYYKMDDNQDLCEMLDIYTNNLKLIASNTTNANICVPTKSGDETYINSIITGCACIIPYFVSGVLVNKVEIKRLYLVVGLILSGIILGMRWANTNIVIATLFTITNAGTGLMMGFNIALIAENFNTSTKALAISFMMMSGITGTLLGNVIFPVLLELKCVIPFFGLTGIMLLSVCLAMMLPKKNNLMDAALL